MIDIDEIMKRAQAASDRASQQLNENIEKGQKIAEQMKAARQQAQEQRGLEAPKKDTPDRGER